MAGAPGGPPEAPAPARGAVSRGASSLGPVGGGGSERRELLFLVPLLPAVAGRRRRRTGRRRAGRLRFAGRVTGRPPPPPPTPCGHSPGSAPARRALSSDGVPERWAPRGCRQASSGPRGWGRGGGLSWSPSLGPDSDEALCPGERGGGVGGRPQRDSSGAAHAPPAPSPDSAAAPGAQGTLSRSGRPSFSPSPHSAKCGPLGPAARHVPSRKEAAPSSQAPGPQPQLHLPGREDFRGPGRWGGAVDVGPLKIEGHGPPQQGAQLVRGGTEQIKGGGRGRRVGQGTVAGNPLPSLKRQGRRQTPPVSLQLCAFS